jgi:hypothetical protein
MMTARLRRLFTPEFEVQTVELDSHAVARPRSVHAMVEGQWVSNLATHGQDQAGACGL